MATINKIDSITLTNDYSKSYYIGYKSLDSILNGLKEGTIVTIGARPAMGKTTFIHNIVLNLMEQYNLPTLHISLETSKETLALKLATIVSQRSYKDVKNDSQLSQNIIDTLHNKKYNLYISDDCFNVQELEQMIIEKGNIKFLVIDYIQLMQSDKDYTSSTDSYNDVLDRIKVLAIKYKLVVFLISQISRNVEHRMDKRPMLMDLRNSGNLENHSDVVIFLYRDSYYNYDRKDTTEIIVSKNRGGSVAATYLDYNIEKSNFIDY